MSFDDKGLEILNKIINLESEFKVWSLPELTSEFNKHCGMHPRFTNAKTGMLLRSLKCFHQFKNKPSFFGDTTRYIFVRRKKKCQSFTENIRQEENTINI